MVLLVRFLQQTQQNDHYHQCHFCIYASPHDLLQYIKMVKLCYLFGLQFLHSLSQNIMPVPDPPIQIKTRIISVQDLFTSFVDGFCGKCDPTSSTCNRNFINIYSNPLTQFNPQTIINNPNNITRVKSIIESVNGSYSFPNRELKKTTLRYVINLPLDVQKINGVVLYFHSTTFGTLQIPTAQTTQISAIAALYASSGYAVVFPNYLGYQTENSYPHPYLMYPRQNVNSAINVLNSALETIMEQYAQMNLFPLFTAGYSEGASYALWFEKCLQQPDKCQAAKLNSTYIFKGAVGLSGPYDIQATIKSFLTQKIKKDTKNAYKIQNQVTTNFAKPPRLAMALISYIYYNKGTTNYENDIQADFWRMKCNKFLSDEDCQIEDIQYEDIFRALKSKKGSIQIAEAISYSSFGKQYNNVQKKEKYLGTFGREYLWSGRNSVYGLANQTIVNQKDFNDTLRAASAINNTPNTKVFLFSLKRDSIVPVSNTEIFESKYGRNKVETYYFENRDYQICQKQGGSGVPVDHNDAQILANIFALTFIKSIERV